jgi:hypothetical protein
VSCKTGQLVLRSEKLPLAGKEESSKKVPTTTQLRISFFTNLSRIVEESCNVTVSFLL